jgi:proteasome lid subunit RPN8/RPN11
MVAHARSALPNECCGLLAGTADGRVLRRYPLDNAAASPTQYLSEPRSMLAAMKDMRSQSIDVLAVYHSHPTSEPVPSKTDLELNYSSQVVNFIISLKDGEARLRGWWLDDASYHEAEWDLID